MTIQNQVPKIIIALILITFSYAISGFLTDVMWLSTYVGINTLGDAIDQPDVAGDATKNLLNNPLYYTSNVLNSGREDDWGPWDGIRHVSSNVGDFAADTADDAIFDIFGLRDPGECASLTGGIDVSNCVKAGLQAIVRVFLDKAVTLIVFFAILIALVRVWFMLLKSYVYVLIYTILSPLWFLLGLLPESKFGFTNWLRAFTARLMVFPATALLLLSARIFIDSAAFQTGGTNQTDFVPPLIGNPNILEGTGIGYLIAFGIIMLGPEMLQIMMDAFKTQPFKYTPAITGGFARGAAVGAGIGAIVTGAAFKGNQKMAGIVPTIARSKYESWRGDRPPRTFLGRQISNLRNKQREYARRDRAHLYGTPPEPPRGDTT